MRELGRRSYDGAERELGGRSYEGTGRRIWKMCENLQDGLHVNIKTLL